MAHAYTPGLKVTPEAVIRKSRILPIQGDVLVKKGDLVDSEDVVARTQLPGDVFPINVANQLGLEAKEIKGAMLKQEGEAVEADEILASSSSFFGMFKSEVTSPISGTIESISSVTGQVILRGAPQPVEVKAYLSGTVTDVLEGEGVEIQARSCFIQGIFGVGGETGGEIVLALNGPQDLLDAGDLKEDYVGKIVVGGRMVTSAAIRKAVDLGINALVVGGIDDRDLRDFLGYDLGVAITGQENLGITLVVTEGFGEIDMAERTWDLLKNHQGRFASVNGATQIRAGVIRPEIVIPIKTEVQAEAKRDEGSILQSGMPVRCIRTPYFGKIGSVRALPSELSQLESETHVRVLDVEFEGGETATLPRANVEVIEE